MEPIVYIYQDHLQDFWNSGQSQCFGAAFEWKGEQVYHVYIKYPQVAPTGYSMPCTNILLLWENFPKLF